LSPVSGAPDIKDERGLFCFTASGENREEYRLDTTLTGALMERLDDAIGAGATLTERVDKLIEAGSEPLLATASTSAAVRELAARIEALGNALREIALEVQELAAHNHLPHD
jgi:hypothetical protein